MKVWVLVGMNNLVRMIDVVGVYSSESEALRTEQQDRYSDETKIYERDLQVSAERKGYGAYPSLDKMLNPTVSAEHTPLPWHFTDQLENTGQAFYTVGATDEIGERFHDIRFLPPVSDWRTAHANALLIERAVNCHQELVEALEKAENAIQKVASVTDENRLGWALQAIEAALAKAKGDA